MGLRKLEEQFYHLYHGQYYTKLKKQLSIIENFLLMFNPHNKFDLSRYW